MRILYIEDDEVDRMAFERFVRQVGLPYEYTVAGSVAAAKEALGAGEFDVILLDYSLGDGTAFDVLELEPSSPVVLITGANQIDIAVAAMKAGAYDYLVKDQERDYLQVLPLAVEGAIRRREDDEKTRVLSHAVMSAAESVFITDLDDVVTFINRAVTDTYGCREEDILGSGIGIIGEISPDGEHSHRRADGGEFPVFLTRSAVKDDKGRDIAYVVMVRDITEQKRSEQELRRINAELEGFARTVSHDLKGPLTGIILASSTLESIMRKKGLMEVSPDFPGLMDVIEKYTWKSSALIDDLLALARAGQKPEEVEEVDVSGLVDRILEESEGAIKEKGLRVEVEGPLGVVLADPTHMYQLFANLIGNCIRHCDSDQPVVKVESPGDDGEGRRRYLVRDNGSGFPPGDLERIFEPFFKGKSGGTGIGLATVEKIVNLYGGDVRAYNDGGACFEFSLGDYAFED